MKYEDSFKDYINLLVMYLRRMAWCGEYSYKLVFATDNVREDGGSVDAMINIDPTYLNFKLTVMPILQEEYWGKARDYKYLGEVILHEICHILLAPLQAHAKMDVKPSIEHLVQQTVERQTQRVANTIADLLPTNWYMPLNLKKAMK